MKVDHFFLGNKKMLLIYRKLKEKFIEKKNNFKKKVNKIELKN